MSADRLNPWQRLGWYLAMAAVLPMAALEIGFLFWAYSWADGYLLRPLIAWSLRDVVAFVVGCVGWLILLGGFGVFIAHVMETADDRLKGRKRP